MNKKTRAWSPQEKSQVALAAIKGEKTMSQISSDYEVHPAQIGLWRKQALENLPKIFQNDNRKEKQKESERQEQLNNLYKIIGERDAELDWLKKKLSVFNSG